MNQEVQTIELVLQRATIEREMEVLSVFRGGGPDPAAVMRLRAEAADLDERIKALQAGEPPPID